MAFTYNDTSNTCNIERRAASLRHNLVPITQIPLLSIIVYNSTMTVDNMRSFSEIFASQSVALKTERRKTEDLLTEMLPRSVAKQLRAGKAVQAEEFEVRAAHLKCYQSLLA